MYGNDSLSTIETRKGYTMTGHGNYVSKFPGDVGDIQLKLASKRKLVLIQTFEAMFEKLAILREAIEEFC